MTTRAERNYLVARINAEAGTPTDDGKLEQIGAQGSRDVTHGYDTKSVLGGKQS